MAKTHENLQTKRKKQNKHELIKKTNKNKQKNKQKTKQT